MSLLYKSKEEQTTTCEIKQEDGRIVLDFYSDCGKFGTDEMLESSIRNDNVALQVAAACMPRWGLFSSNLIKSNTDG